MAKKKAKGGPRKAEPNTNKNLGQNKDKLAGQRKENGLVDNLSISSIELGQEDLTMDLDFLKEDIEIGLTREEIIGPLGVVSTGLLKRKGVDGPAVGTQTTASHTSAKLPDAPEEGCSGLNKDTSPRPPANASTIAKTLDASTRHDASRASQGEMRQQHRGQEVGPKQRSWASLLRQN